MAKAGRVERQTPFELRVPEGEEFYLEAPKELRIGGAEFEFAGWSVPGRRGETNPRIALKLSEALRVVAYYEQEEEAKD
ncbi:MAG: hypothetical protein ACTHU0_38340, partial [Kofleriaceae bacterium]